MNAIEVTDLTVRRGDRTVLDRLSCAIPEGRITGLLGPSGAGKTTLIRAIVGVQRIAGGTVTVFGHPAGSLPLRRRIGYLTQSPAIYADITVAENVRYFGTIARASAAQVEAVIAEVGLADATHQLARTLSGGQQSRASLACALVGDPPLLVLDEPTVGQDPVLREELWAAMHRRADAGATIVLSSHVMDEASRCDRLVLIRDGAFLAVGTPAEIAASAGTTDMDAAFLTLIRRRGTDSRPTGPAATDPDRGGGDPPSSTETGEAAGRHAATQGVQS